MADVNSAYPDIAIHGNLLFFTVANSIRPACMGN